VHDVEAEPAGDGEDASDERDGRARFALVRQLAIASLLVPAAGSDTIQANARLLRLLRAGSPAVGRAPARRLERIQVSVADVEADAVVRRDLLGRALTGRILPGEAAVSGLRVAIGGVQVALGTPSDTFEPAASAGGWIEPTFLNDQGLPPCQVGATLDATHALLTPMIQRRSVVIDAHGGFDYREPWPRPILGELGWGDSGGTVAWYNGDEPYLMLREAAGREARLIPVPFRPNRICVEPDGAVVAATADGLWRWSAQEGPTRMADMPAAVAIRPAASGYRIDPIVKDDVGFTIRTHLRHAWQWETGLTAPRRIDLGPDGPCWSISTGGAWTAAAFPHADRIRLTHPDGGVFTLLCYYPVTVAWAAGSLVVVSGTSGSVLLFENLLTTLAAI
jgi:hypothetical protein